MPRSIRASLQLFSVQRHTGQDRGYRAGQPALGWGSGSGGCVAIDTAPPRRPSGVGNPSWATVCTVRSSTSRASVPNMTTTNMPTAVRRRRRFRYSLLTVFPSLSWRCVQASWSNTDLRTRTLPLLQVVTEHPIIPDERHSGTRRPVPVTTQRWRTDGKRSLWVLLCDRARRCAEHQAEVHDLLARQYNLRVAGRFMPHATIKGFFRSDAPVAEMVAALDVSPRGQEADPDFEWRADRVWHVGHCRQYPPRRQRRDEPGAASVP